MKLKFVVFAALLAAPASAQAPAQTLTMEQAVEIAMHQQPSLRLSRSQVEAARGRVDSVKTNLHPQVELSAGVDVSGGGGSDVRNLNSGLSVGANASWRITDFGQTRAQVRAAELNVEAALAGTQTDVLDVRSNVEVSYLEAIARARAVTVSETTVKSEETHLDQAKRFVAAQAKDPIEVVEAQARAANARAALAEAQAQAARALANLRSAIGWVDPTQTLAIGQTWPTAPPDTSPPALPALVETARAKRPELVQLDRQVAAAEANIDVAAMSRRPVLSATARTSYGPGASYAENPMTGRFVSSFDASHPTWSIGLNLSWQIYDGGRQDADLRIARANRESALAQRDVLLLQMTTQLDATRATIEAARVSIVASTEAVTAARAQLQLAEARYAQGLGSQIEITDAQTAVTTAEGNLINAEWGLATAWASLRRQLGTL
jgi:outer membrane protein TolC